MQYWLLKSEPDVWSIDQQKKAGSKGAPWDGVRNYQAAKNLKTMKKGDQCFFYHSNIGKEIVGIVEVIREAYVDKTDQSGRFVAVTVKFIRKLKRPITLENIKKNKELSHLSLIKQSLMLLSELKASTKLERPEYIFSKFSLEDESCVSAIKKSLTVADGILLNLT